LDLRTQRLTEIALPTTQTIVKPIMNRSNPEEPAIRRIPRQ